MLKSRYLGTLAHTMGGRMVWSLDITFDNLPLASTIQVRNVCGGSLIFFLRWGGVGGVGWMMIGWITKILCGRSEWECCAGGVVIG